jgi:hypothetical protein
MTAGYVRGGAVSRFREMPDQKFPTIETIELE